MKKCKFSLNYFYRYTFDQIQSDIWSNVCGGICSTCDQNGSKHPHLHPLHFGWNLFQVTFCIQICFSTLATNWSLGVDTGAELNHQVWSPGRADRYVNIKPNLVTLQQTAQGALIADNCPSFCPSSSSSHVALSEKFWIKVHQFTLVDLLLRLYWTTFATNQPFGQKIVLNSVLKCLKELRIEVISYI